MDSTDTAISSFTVLAVVANLAALAVVRFRELGFVPIPAHPVRALQESRP